MGLKHLSRLYQVVPNNGNTNVTYIFLNLYGPIHVVYLEDPLGICFKGIYALNIRANMALALNVRCVMHLLPSNLIQRKTSCSRCIFDHSHELAQTLAQIMLFYRTW